ncbi:hypothetical protein Mapa_000627 [Marchantia paleacea]|nr:hypothetical protein Mapa_000627 [Marchantia paleacea]
MAGTAGTGAGSTLRWLYLSAYNVVLFFGWLQILYLAIEALRKDGPASVYAAVEKPLQIWQTAACFEIFNSIVGIVRSPVTATLPQISSRLYVTWGILYSFPETREHFLVTSLILSWGVTEVIRYLFFALKEAFGVTPPLLLWIRYSTFFILYPTGIFSEAGLIYVALPFMKVSDLYCLRMPNVMNYAFDYYCAAILILGLYVPGGPYMYTYMIGQRKKALGKHKEQ